jgi:hypothetical protein
LLGLNINTVWSVWYWPAIGGQHVVLVYEDDEDQTPHFEGWELPDRELIFHQRRYGCQVEVTQDMLS